MNDTIIRQYAKRSSKTYLNEFYNYIFNLLLNLIETDIDKNLKMVFVNYLMFEKQMIFFKNKDEELQIGKISRMVTRDENLLPIDVKVTTIDGTPYELFKENYVMLYNPIATDYLKLKIDEIANIEKIIEFLRKLYKTPIIFQSKDTKVLRSIKDFISKVFSYDEICTITSTGFDDSKKLEVIDLKIQYMTDKLLDENESLKEDILEIFGIYKNTSGNRERVNESELIVSNSLTTVNKLGIESTFEECFDEIQTKLGFNHKIELNINKVFDNFKQDTQVTKEETK